MKAMQRIDGLLATMFFATAAIAQNAPVTALRATAATTTPATAVAPPTVATSPAASHKISYKDGQLRIDVVGSTLGDVLTQVAALTGVKIDIPAGANTERMPVVDLGPGPAREVLASLLSDSNFDYLIQASDTDAEKLQSVLVMAREKKGAAANVVAAVRPSRGPDTRAAAEPPPPPEPPAAESPVPAQPEVAPPPPPPPAPATQADLTAPSAAAALDSNQFPLLQQDPAFPTRPGALAPPTNLTPQGINQQLQQMYQQRIQINQQTQPAHQ